MSHPKINAYVRGKSESARNRGKAPAAKKKLDESNLVDSDRVTRETLGMDHSPSQFVGEIHPPSEIHHQSAGRRPTLEPNEPHALRRPPPKPRPVKIIEKTVGARAEECRPASRREVFAVRAESNVRSW